MLRRFQAINKVNAHPLLPQSESDASSIAGVHCGYSTALLLYAEGGWYISIKDFSGYHEIEIEATH